MHTRNHAVASVLACDLGCTNGKKDVLLIQNCWSKHKICKWFNLSRFMRFVRRPARPKICVGRPQLILSTGPTETPFTGCCVKWFIEIVVIIKERVQAMTSKIRLQGVCFNFPPSKSAVPNWVPPRGPFCGFGFPLGLLFVPRSPFSPL